MALAAECEPELVEVAADHGCPLSRNQAIRQIRFQTILFDYGLSKDKEASHNLLDGRDFRGFSAGPPTRLSPYQGRPTQTAVKTERDG